jgi:hypothetical protein
MATGDVTVFNEAKGYLIDGGWEAADSIKCAVVTNAVAPTAATVTPQLADFTEVSAAGTYTAGGAVLDTLGTMVTVTGAEMKFDSGTNPTWAQDASNGTDARWGIIYNVTQAGNNAIAFVELGAADVDMTAGDLTITWNASGIFTIT